jgi:hypothetical protein
VNGRVVALLCSLMTCPRVLVIPPTPKLKFWMSITISHKAHKKNSHVAPDLNVFDSERHTQRSTNTTFSLSSESHALTDPLFLC